MSLDERLEKLSENLPDLTDPKVLTKERLEKMIASNLGFDLFYGTERIDKKIFQALLDFAKQKKAVEKMIGMQEGDVVNVIQDIPSENRPALHCATRDFFDDVSSSQRATLARERAKEELTKLEKFEEKMQKFDHVVQIGIGGSELGPRAIYEGLVSFHKKGKTVDFISNIDPDNISYILEKYDLKKTLFISVSKSGTTLETTTNEKIIRQLLEKAGLKSQNQIVSVTQKDTPMDDKEKYLECFYIWDYIGGRFSATSMVGGVVLTFGLGMDFYKEILRGASAMDLVVRSEEDNLPLLAALFSVWNTTFCSLPTLSVVFYSHFLSSFVSHLKQLEMESNGKAITKDGKNITFSASPILWGGVGSNAQHSFFQLLHQGPPNAALELVGFKKGQYDEDFLIDKTTSQEKLLSNLFAQSLSLAKGSENENPNVHFPGNRPSHILIGRRLDPYSMGALLSFYEHKIVFEGFFWNINSFDQEGVQLGKKLANDIIKIYKKEKDHKFDLAEVFIKRLQEKL